MTELTKLEEQILLSVWRLQENAYGITIFKNITKITGKKMAIGGIYFPLERLVKRGFLKAFKGEPTAVRGGQSKRYYLLTEEGFKLLQKSKATHAAFWDGLPEFSHTKEGAE
jgi:DNA-binding PadR family transcriptional regulator